ncbi:MAG TPA: M23 family metallopeptidase, partial [Thermoanaerobaculia bacterium]|nr:M23 family metallopeptidase [Thermoanaerobaculia bacterium]
RVLAFAGAGSAFVLVSAFAFGWAFFSSAGRDRLYRRALAENARLSSTTAALSRQLDGLSRQLDEFDTRTQRLAIVAGLSQSGPGVGGPIAASPPSGSGLSDRGNAIGSRLAALESQFARRSAIVSSTPTVAPVRGLLNSGFGTRQDPFTGEEAYHSGLDISTRRDEPVLATAEGVVIKSGWSGDYGKTVEIAHATGFTTVYGHLDAILVKEGQRVNRGERVGLVGSTGRSTGPHLHYEVRQGGRVVNPLDYILDAQ